MKDTPDISISVIIPVFNAEKRLRLTLDAVLAQTFDSFELILVNDGSRDRSLEICREYQTRRPDRITVLDGPNQGVSLARNRGLDAARGEWIAFCDADDQPEPGWLETLHEQALRSRADLSCGAFLDVSPETQSVRMNFAVTGPKELLDGPDEVRRRFLLPLFSGSPAVHGYLFASLFRRDIIERQSVRFTAGVSMKEDELFYMDYLGRTNRIIASAGPLYRYIRSGEDSATARHRKSADLFREKNWRNYADARVRIFRKYELEKTYPVLEQKLLLRCFVHKAQTVCCDPEAGFFEKRRELREIARSAEKERPHADGMSERIFLLALLHFRFLLPLLCAVQRRREKKRRTAS